MASWSRFRASITRFSLAVISSAVIPTFWNQNCFINLVLTEIKGWLGSQAWINPFLCWLSLISPCPKTLQTKCFVFVFLIPWLLWIMKSVDYSSSCCNFVQYRTDGLCITHDAEGIVVKFVMLQADPIVNGVLRRECCQSRQRFSPENLYR